MDNYKNDQAIQILNEEQYDGADAQIRIGYIINEFPVGGDLSIVVRQLDGIDKIEDTCAPGSESILVYQGSIKAMGIYGHAAGSGRLVFIR